MAQSKTKIIVALDVPTFDEAKRLVDMFKGTDALFKVGLQLYNALLLEGGFARFKELGIPQERLMLDLKIHDIPETARKTLNALLTKINPFFLTFHTGGGVFMAKAMKEETDAFYKKTSIPVNLLGVTVLTSLRMDDVKRMNGYNCDCGAKHQVFRLASEVDGFADGIVCSAQELDDVKAASKQFLRVIPGTRSAGADTHDQKRVATPAEAAMAGADFLVIGREITQAEDPLAAFLRIEADIAAAFKSKEKAA